MPTPLSTVFGLLAVALIGALAKIAYTHPREYRQRVLPFVGIPSMLIFMGLVVHDVAVLDGLVASQKAILKIREAYEPPQRPPSVDLDDVPESERRDAEKRHAKQMKKWIAEAERVQLQRNAISEAHEAVWEVRQSEKLVTTWMWWSFWAFIAYLWLLTLISPLLNLEHETSHVSTNGGSASDVEDDDDGPDATAP